MRKLRCKLIATAVAVSACWAGTAARAAPIDFILVNAGGGSWNLSINNTSGKGIGALAMFTDPGFTAVSFNPADLAISVPDSVLTIDPLGYGVNFLVVNNIVGLDIAPSGSSTLICTLTATGPLGTTRFGSVLLYATDNLGIPTAYDVAGNPFPDSSYRGIAFWPAPEPEVALLLGLAGFAWVLARR